MRHTDDGVAVVTLNRPERLNALDQELFDALPLTFRVLGETSSVRAAVLTGAGRAFCAGADVSGAGGFAYEAGARA